MAYLLNVGYLIALALFSPWMAWQAWRKGKYRDGWDAKFWGRVPLPPAGYPCVWLHAVSVGEVALLGGLIAELRKRHGDWQFFITTTTSTGYQLAQSRYVEHTVAYCPMDFTWAVGRVMRMVRPKLLILAELELWPNLIAAAKKNGARVAVINGRLSEPSFRGYRRIRWLLSPTLAKIDLWAVQTHTYAQRFKALGAIPENVHVTGSLKFDGAKTDRANQVTRALAQLAAFGPRDIVFLAGSTQEPEEAMALQTFQDLSHWHPRLRLVLVPRHPERFEEVAQLLTAAGLAWQRRSEFDTRPAKPHVKVLLVDRMGELAAWWGTCHVAFVGGSFGPREGQNMIEPAAYGAAVSFGPRTRNFREVVTLLLEQEAAEVVNSGQELTDFVRRMLEQPAAAERMGAKAQGVVRSQLGATVRTGDLLDTLFESRIRESANRAA